MTDINLSYVIATRNRLTFLKITLQRLMDNLQPDEEIVVVDGNSTDGAKEYLQQLFDEGKVHQFLSGSDKNQAHGWNKAFLMAKGTLIKKIMDDDVFCYQAIRVCKEYMLQQPLIDVIISNDAGSRLDNYKFIEKYNRLPEFEKWRNKSVSSFTFSDVHMLIRRSSLAYIGLYNTAYINMDWEYSLRMTHLQVKIAFNTGYNALNVAHPQTVTSLRNERLIQEQGRKGAFFYDYAGDKAGISNWSKLKIAIGKLLYTNKFPDDKLPAASGLADLDVIYSHYYAQLSEFNKDSDFKFITN